MKRGGFSPPAKANARRTLSVDYSHAFFPSAISNKVDGSGTKFKINLEPTATNMDSKASLQ